MRAKIVSETLSDKSIVYAVRLTDEDSGHYVNFDAVDYASAMKLVEALQAAANEYTTGAVEHAF